MFEADTALYPVGLISPDDILQVYLTPAYAYLEAYVIPFLAAHWIPKFSKPPSQAYEDLSQSTNYYSDKSLRVESFLILQNASIPPTAENAQHDPQLP